MPADVMWCEVEAGATTPKVRPWPHRTGPPYDCSASRALVLHTGARQTDALTRGGWCKPVVGLSEGPPSCYCLWFECVVGQGGGVLRCGPNAPGGKPCPKSRGGGGGRAESGRPANGWRMRGGWSPCPCRASVGLGCCVGATTSTSTGATISAKKPMSWRREHLHG